MSENTFFCIEILGESAFHKFLVQSGWSGKDYLFHYNRHTNSHMRAYRSIDDYRAERVDMHKSATIWPLLGNILSGEQIEPHAFTTGTPKAGVVAEPVRKRAPRRSRVTEEVSPEPVEEAGNAELGEPAEEFSPGE